MSPKSQNHSLCQNSKAAVSQPVNQSLQGAGPWQLKKDSIEVTFKDNNNSNIKGWMFRHVINDILPTVTMITTTIHSGCGVSTKMPKWRKLAKHSHGHLWVIKKLLGHPVYAGGKYALYVFSLSGYSLQLYRDPGLTVLVSNNSEPQPRWALDRLAPGHHYTARFWNKKKKESQQQQQQW